jgi:hypothetical protein
MLVWTPSSSLTPCPSPGGDWLKELLGAELAEWLTVENVLDLAEDADRGGPPSLLKACNRVIAFNLPKIRSLMLARTEQMGRDDKTAQEITRVKATQDRLLGNAIRAVPNFAVFETTKEE